MSDELNVLYANARYQAVIVGGRVCLPPPPDVLFLGL